MRELKNKPEPKRIKMPPLLDRSNQYDTLSFDSSEHTTEQSNENHQQNNTQSIQQLESDPKN